MKDRTKIIAFIILLVTLFFIRQEAYPQSRQNFSKLGDSGNNSFWYAVGIQGTSASAKIQAALDSATAGSTVYAQFVGTQSVVDTIVISKNKTKLIFGAGSYTMSANMYLSITGDDVTIEADGATFNANASTVSPVVYVTGDRATLRGFNIEAPNGANAIQVVGSVGTLVENVNVNKSNYGIYTTNVQDFTVRDCRLDSTYRTSIWIDSIATGVTIEHNRITKSAILNSGAHAAIKVVGHRTAGSFDSDIRILNNTIDSAMVLGIGVNSATGDLTQRVTISGNTINVTGLGAGGTDSEGISFTMKDFTVINNWIGYSAATGILAYGQCENGLIGFNRGKENTNHLVQLMASLYYGTGTMTSITVVNNTDEDAASPKTQATVKVEVEGAYGGYYSRLSPIIIMGNGSNQNAHGGVSFQNDSLRNYCILAGNAPELLTGSGTISTSGTTVTGSLTKFLTGNTTQKYMYKGQWLRVGTTGQNRQIVSIAHDSSLTIDRAFDSTFTGRAFQYYDDPKTVKVNASRYTTPMVLEIQGEDATYTAAIRILDTGTGAQITAPLEWYSNDLRVGRIYTDNSLLDLTIDNKYTYAQRINLDVRGTTVFAVDTAGRIDLPATGSIYVGGTLFSGGGGADSVVDLLDFDLTDVGLQNGDLFKYSTAGEWYNGRPDTSNGKYEDSTGVSSVSTYGGSFYNPDSGKFLIYEVPPYREPPSSGRWKLVGYPDSVGVERDTLDLEFFLSTEASAMVTTDEQTYTLPHAFKLIQAYAFVTTAGTGTTSTIDILENGVSIFGITKITINASAQFSTNQYDLTESVLTIADNDLARHAILKFDCVTAGTNVKGCKVILKGYIP